VSHIRHFHWIAALHNYRAQMQDALVYLPNAAPPYTKLIQDECNAYQLEVRPQPPGPSGSWAGVLRARLRELRDKLLQSMIVLVLDHHFPEPVGWRDRRLALAYFGPPARFFHFSRRDATRYELGLAEAHHGDAAAQIVFSGTDTDPVPGVFCLCAPIYSLSHWSKLEKSCDAMLRRGTDVVLIYVVAGQQAKTFNEEHWILSRVLTYFPSDRYQVSVAAHPLTPAHQQYLAAVAPLRGYDDLLRPWFWPALLRVARAISAAIASRNATSPKPAKSVAQEFWALSIHLAPPRRPGPDPAGVGRGSAP
jgi:hypothetical protein